MSSLQTRRAFLAILPQVAAAARAATKVQIKKPRELPRVGEFVRLTDPVTENIVVRLTSLASANVLPSPERRFVSVRDRFLLFSSDRSGRFAPYRLDLRTGAIEQICPATELNTRSLCMDDSEQFAFFLDGRKLMQMSPSGRGEPKAIAEDVDSFVVGHRPADVLLVRHGELQTPDGQVIAANVECQCIVMQPGGSACAFLRAGELWLASGSQTKRLAAGDVSFPYWSPDGQSVLFLRKPEKGSPFIAQVTLDGQETRVVSTSQFAAFAPNRDATVFVGSADSKAQPDVVLLLRSPQREMTLCEHKASNAKSVTPVFAPDSRRVYFESDREGKPAVYSVPVELLVEPT